MKLGFGSDHAGFELKVELIKYLESKGFEIKDFGPYSDERADYPDFAHPVALAVENKEVDLGIIMCGSGNGINMAANKHQDIRSALCWEPELASLARQHNDANICALPARFIAVEKAKEIVDSFLSHEFEGGRHAGRVDKISC
jgi:ribose 5-phosphate isomerase B